MKYRVEWTPDAERELAELWNTSANRGEITYAADTIDAILARDPLSFGESREGTSRIGFEMPLTVSFDVDFENDLVSVWQVRRRSR